MTWLSGAVDLDVLNAALGTRVNARTTNQLNRSAVIAQILQVRPTAGKIVAFDAVFGTTRPTTAPIQIGADVSVFNNDTEIMGTLRFGSYHDAFAVSGADMNAVMSQRNPEQLVDFLAYKGTQSANRLAAVLNYEFYNGTGAVTDTPTINGFYAASSAAPVLAATGTYANIDRSSYPQWASNVLDNGGVVRAFSTDLMQHAEAVVYDGAGTGTEGTGKTPDVWLCGSVVHELLGRTFTERRYTQDIMIRGQKITLSGGYKALEFQGIPVIRDKWCPAGVMIGLNSEHVYMTEPSDIWQYMGDSTRAIVGTDEEQYGASQFKLTCKTFALARTGDHLKLASYMYPQAVCDRPMACVIIKDLPTSV
jgi:hypothetical protein